MGGCAKVFLAVMGLLAFFYFVGACSEKPRSYNTSAPAAPVNTALNQSAQAAAVSKFTGLPAIEHVEWLDGDFIIAALNNGKTWQPVADTACAWIRGQGMQGPFAVVILEAGALRNKRWDQMARARCN